jgi:hypothetical protein
MLHEELLMHGCGEEGSSDRCSFAICTTRGVEGCKQKEEKRLGKRKKQEKKLTPRYLPDATLGHTKLDVFDINCDFAFMYEENHLHLARVLHAFVAVWWNLDHAGSKKWKGHNLRIAERRAVDVLRFDRCRSKCNI